MTLTTRTMMPPEMTFDRAEAACSLTSLVELAQLRLDVVALDARLRAHRCGSSVRRATIMTPSRPWSGWSA